MNIIFMGTPDFAEKVLEGLISSRHNVISVYTGKDKEKGRGHKLMPSPVKELALKHDIPIYQPATLRNEDVIEEIKSQSADVIVVAAYGKILPKAVLSAHKYGAINVHGSLLPKYRGASPIQSAVLNGEKETGITIMQMSEGLDCGDILYQKKTEIGEYENSGELFDRMALLGADALIEALDLIEAGKVTPISQNDDEATYAPMLSKEMSHIDFNKSAREIKNLIYGLNPWPSARIMLAGNDIKLLGCEVCDRQDLEIGQVYADKKELIIGCHDGSVKITRLQKQGKKPMNTSDFLNGVKIPSGSFVE